MFDKSEFYRLRQMEEGFIGKWKRIPGSGRAEDVCWDRQGHRRVVCTSFTILYNAQSYTILNNALQHNPQLYIYTMHKLHNSKQCPEKVHTVHSSLHSHKIPLKLDFFDAPAIPLLGELFQSTHTCCTCCTCCIQCTLENVFTEFEHGSHV